ncbi:MAG: leucine-rich repeat domain-containing protein [Gemmatimonadota bacterium]|jgi:hypothetical protein
MEITESRPFGLLGRLLRHPAVTVSVLALATASCGSPTEGEDDDEEPPPAPAAVTDLRVVEVTPTSATLAWTAPVVDQTHGYTSAYDIRYTTSEPQGASAWDTAVQLEGEPGPALPGSEQVWTVDGLQYGQTYYFAMKCGGEGDSPRWSALSNLAEATLPIDFEVPIPDDALESALRGVLDKPSGALMYSDLLTLTELELSDRGIADLSGLEHCENLLILRATDNALTDLSPLSDLPSLEGADLVANQISDVSPLAGLTTLRHLHLAQNQLSDISPLSALTSLEVFRAHTNSLTDIGVIEGMTQLEWLDLRYNGITDITPLVDNTGLGEGDLVELNGNPLSDTAVQTDIPALRARGVDVKF